jgi:hypothetical protein
MGERLPECVRGDPMINASEPGETAHTLLNVAED